MGVERPILFGHSDGASIALIFAGTFPERVRALALEAPHVFVEAISVRSIAEIGQEFRSGQLRERMMRYHADVDRTFFGWNDVWLSPQFADWNITASLATLRSPALCIQGSGDEYGTLAQLDAIATASPSPVDRLILSGCGHSPHRDRAQLVVSASADWILGSLQ